MSNSQQRASRHASGILPSRQFFSPRKPIPSYSGPTNRRRSALSLISESAGGQTSPDLQAPPTPSRAQFSPTIGSQLTPIPSDNENVTSPQTAIALNTLSSAHDAALPNPSLDQSLDVLYNSNPKHTSAQPFSGPPPQGRTGGATDISQAAIDSVLEPPTALDAVLEPTSYRRSAGALGTRKQLTSTRREMFTSIPYSSMSTQSHPRFASRSNVGRRRIYEVWPGRNRFFLGGRIMTSRDFPAFVVALCALLMPCCLFMGYTCPYLFHHVSPAVVFVFVYLFLLALTSMLRTSWTDPGIIPRNLDPAPPTEDLEMTEHNIQNNQQFSYYSTRSLPLPKDVKINGQSVILKYCETCKIYRPPRCSHCRQCNNCVENEDHHCIWLNNCIGRRNYRSFFTFIVTATLLCFYVLGFSVAHLWLYSKENNKNILETIEGVPISFVLALVAFFLMWSVGGLTLYHTYLISKNLTTHEQLRAPLARRNGARQNPFDHKNVFVNCFWVLCRPLTQSTVNPRGYIEDDSWEDPERQEGSSSDRPLQQQQQQQQQSQEEQQLPRTPVLQPPPSPRRPPSQPLLQPSSQPLPRPFSPQKVQKEQLSSPHTAINIPVSLSTTPRGN